MLTEQQASGLMCLGCLVPDAFGRLPYRLPYGHGRALPVHVGPPEPAQLAPRMPVSTANAKTTPTPTPANAEPRPGRLSDQRLTLSAGEGTDNSVFCGVGGVASSAQHRF